MHEVTHLIDKTHNFSFRKSQALVKTYSWMREHRPESSLENDIDRWGENVATATDDGLKEPNAIHVKRCEHCNEEISKVMLRKNTGGSCDIRVPAVAMPFVCKYCGGSYCEDHRLPENHKCIGLRLRKSVVRAEEITGGLIPLDDETKSLIIKRMEENKECMEEQDTSQSGTERKMFQNNDLRLKKIEDTITDLHNRYMASLIGRDEYFDTLRSLNHEKRKLLYGKGLNEGNWE